MSATDPKHIAISKSKGISIDWNDGHASSYGLDYLREQCPCASCTGAHGTPPTAKPTDLSGSKFTSGVPHPFPYLVDKFFYTAKSSNPGIDCAISTCRAGLWATTCTVIRPHVVRDLCTADTSCQPIRA